MCASRARGAFTTVTRATAAIGVLVLAVALLHEPLHAQATRAEPLRMQQWRHAVESVALDVRLGDDTSTTLVARMAPSGTVWLPLARVAALAGVRPTLDSLGRPSRNGPQRRGRPAPHTRDTIAALDTEALPAVVREGDTTWVSVTRTAQWLGVTVVSDRAEAAVHFDNIAHLPGVERRAVQRLALQRLAARRLAESGASLTAISTHDATVAPKAHGLVSLDYNVLLLRRGGPAATPAWAPAGWTRDAVVVGATRAAGGVLTARYSSYAGSDDNTWRRTLSSLHWMRLDDQRGAFSIVQLGAVDDDGLRPGSLIGVSVGSAPVDVNRPRLVPMTRAVDGEWSYAAMANGEWFPAPVVDGRVLLDVPVRGDLARYELYGWRADGQRRHQSLLVQAPAALLERGRWTQQSTLGACPAHRIHDALEDRLHLFEIDMADCRWRAGTDWRYGMASNVTVRGGVQLADRWRLPYVGLTTSMAGHTVVDLLGGVMRSAGAGPARTDITGSAQLTWNPAPTQLVALSSRIDGESRTSALRTRLGSSQLGDAVAIEQWFTQVSRPQLTQRIGASVSSTSVRNDPALRTGASGTTPSSGTMHRATGTLLLDLARGRVQAGSERQAGRGRVSVREWLDRNCDGKRDADEPVVPGGCAC